MCRFAAETDGDMLDMVRRYQTDSGVPVVPRPRGVRLITDGASDEIVEAARKSAQGTGEGCHFLEPLGSMGGTVFAAAMVVVSLCLLRAHVASQAARYSLAGWRRTPSKSKVVVGSNTCLLD